MTGRITIGEDSVPRLPTGVRLHHDRQRERWVLLAPERLFVLDEVALAVIERCDGKASVRAIVDELADRHAAPREVIQGDVVELLQGLADKGVLTA